MNVEKGVREDDEVFEIWKNKLMQHEDHYALMVNYEYRNEKRL